MSITINKKGQTLEEFLAEYKTLGYPSVAVTVDDVVLAINNERLAVLMIKRANFPYIYDWALPGGFVEDHESCEQAAARELAEETGLQDIELEQLYTVSTPNRDPRVRCVSNVFVGFCPKALPVIASDDAEDAAWFTLDFAAKDDMYELVLQSEKETLNAVMRINRCKNGKIDINASEILSQNGIGFDHAKLILYAIETLSN